MLQLRRPDLPNKECNISEISIVIPAYKESGIISVTCDKLRECFPQSEIIVSVNDDEQHTYNEVASSKTADIVLCSNTPNKGAAVRNGVLSSTKDIILIVDADMPIPVDDIKTMITNLKNHEACIGDRHYTGRRLHRSIASYIFNHILLSLYGLKYNDSQCGAKAFRGPVGRSIFTNPLKMIGLTYDVEILARCRHQNIDVVEIPVRWNDNRKHLPMNLAIIDIIKLLKFRFSEDYRAISR